MMKRLFLFLLFVFFVHASSSYGVVKLGVDVFFDEGLEVSLKGKRIGLITNQTAINRSFLTTLDLFKNNSKCSVVAVFAPEHGFYGEAYAYEKVKDQKMGPIPIYSLHDQTRRPNDKMLEEVDVLVYDIQDIGSRSYTFLSTLCYCMEEAAKKGIKFIVLDRPNPLGGELVDGPLMHEKWRSFIGYPNVPYCHGMTIGELARFFNGEHRIGCDLEIIPMKGWKRSMRYRDTDLPWVPTSPQIPEEDTPFFYPATGLIGECSILSVGIGYTLPFKVVGAPWLDAEKFAERLNAQNLPGVHFQPFHFRPFFGKYKLETCHGVRLILTEPKKFLPFTTQYTIIGVVKFLYPEKFHEAIQYIHALKSREERFNKLNGNDLFLKFLSEEQFFVWKIREVLNKDREKFLQIRKKYLIPQYNC